MLGRCGWITGPFTLRLEGLPESICEHLAEPWIGLSPRELALDLADDPHEPTTRNVVESVVARMSGKVLSGHSSELLKCGWRHVSAWARIMAAMRWLAARRKAAILGSSGSGGRICLTHSIRSHRILRPDPPCKIIPEARSEVEAAQVPAAAQAKRGGIGSWHLGNPCKQPAITRSQHNRGTQQPG